MVLHPPVCPHKPRDPQLCSQRPKPCPIHQWAGTNFSKPRLAVRNPGTGSTYQMAGTHSRNTCSVARVARIGLQPTVKKQQPQVHCSPTACHVRSKPTH